jgi:hypothetical protein
MFQRVNTESTYQALLVTGPVSDRQLPERVHPDSVYLERLTMMILVPVVSTVGGEGSVE